MYSVLNTCFVMAFFAIRSLFLLNAPVIVYRKGRFISNNYLRWCYLKYNIPLYLHLIRSVYNFSSNPFSSKKSESPIGDRLRLPQICGPGSPIPTLTQTPCDILSYDNIIYTYKGIFFRLSLSTLHSIVFHYHKHTCIRPVYMWT